MLVANPWGPPLLALFFVLVGSTGALWLQYAFRKRFPSKFKKNLKEVSGKTFRHQEVVIDGKRFTECTFEGVTLVYQGTGYYGFEGNKFSSNFSIRIDSEAAKGGLSIAKLSQHLGIPIQFEGEPPRSPTGNEEKTPH